MPNIKSQVKRVEITAIENARNNAKRTKVKTAIKKFNTAVAAGDKEGAKVLLTAAISEINVAKSDGIFHKNAAARKVSTITKSYDKLVNPEAFQQKADAKVAEYQKIASEKKVAAEASETEAAEKRASLKASAAEEKQVKASEKAKARATAKEKAEKAKASKAVKAPIEEIIAE
jgi:small subunit ribosomal protein S20